MVLQKTKAIVTIMTQPSDPGAEEICANGIDNNCDGMLPVIGASNFEQSAIGTDSQWIFVPETSIDEIQFILLLPNILVLRS